MLQNAVEFRNSRGVEPWELTGTSRNDLHHYQATSRPTPSEARQELRLQPPQIKTRLLSMATEDVVRINLCADSYGALGKSRDA